MTNLQPRALAALVLLLTAVWLLTGCALHEWRRVKRAHRRARAGGGR